VGIARAERRKEVEEREWHVVMTWLLTIGLVNSEKAMATGKEER